MKTGLKFRKLIFTFLSVSAGFSSGAYAGEEFGLFVEPGVTYQTQSSTIRNPAPFNDSTAKVDGFGLMGRLGVHVNEVFFVAADARFALPNYRDTAVNYDTSAMEYDLGPSVGVQMPYAGLRVWGTYILTSQLDPKGTSNLDYKFNDGTGYRIGAGVRLSMVSLNLEYQRIKYASTTFENAAFFTNKNTDAIKFDGEAWIASVSFPLEL